MPSTGQPESYLITYWPGGETQISEGWTTAAFPGFVPQTSPCGVVLVTVQAKDACGKLSAVEDTSGIYTLWR